MAPPGLYLALDPLLHVTTVVAVFAVGLVALGLAFVGMRSYRRSRNPALGFVVAAFAVFAAKGFFTAMSLNWALVPHEHLELLLSLTDLAIVILLAAPLILPRRGNRR